jgi:protein SCO1/2
MPAHKVLFPARTVLLTGLAAAGLVVAGCGERPRAVSAPEDAPARVFPVQGVVREVNPPGRVAVIAHEEIPGYMAAMTMPFRARDTNVFAGVRVGDRIAFRLHVAESESWVTDVAVIARAPGAVPPPPAAPIPPTSTNAGPRRLAEFLADVRFTNELGQPVQWSQFDGRAIGFTFFFTRCPVPEYCPRLTKNFAGAAAKLRGMADAPTNWQLLSITIDPEFDTPAVLRAYAQFHGCDSKQWNFLTAAPADVARLAQLLGLSYRREDGTINHDFRTVVVDARGAIQNLWPVGGDTTDFLVSEIVKAARTTNGPSPRR